MDMKQITKIVMAYELCQEDLERRMIADRLEIGKSTLYRWLDGIREAGGLKEFLDRYEQAKKGPRIGSQIDPAVKRWIWDIRENNNGCCGQKIQYYLEQEKGLHLGIATIYKVLKEKYILRTKWKKNVKRGCIPQASKPREVIQMDSVDFGQVYAFTGVDIYTKEVDVFLSTKLTSFGGFKFLKQAMERRFNKHAELIQTDGGPEFKNRFKENVLKYADRHRIARPYRKNEQAYIESFNRSLRKECLGWQKYKKSELGQLTLKVNNYLEYYHTKRAHCSLGMMTPFQKLNVSHF